MNEDKNIQTNKELDGDQNNIVATHQTLEPTPVMTVQPAQPPAPNTETIFADYTKETYKGHVIRYKGNDLHCEGPYWGQQGTWSLEEAKRNIDEAEFRDALRKQFSKNPWFINLQHKTENLWKVVVGKDIPAEAKSAIDAFAKPYGFSIEYKFRKAVGSESLNNRDRVSEDQEKPAVMTSPKTGQKQIKKPKTGSNQEMVEQQVAERGRKLKKYAEELLKLQSEIEANDVLSVQHGERALDFVIKAGHVLIEAQHLIQYSDARWHQKGLWGKWVEENVKGITFHTVQNWMRVAAEENHRQEMIKFGSTKHVSLRDECKSVREAYRAVGIIKKKLGATKDGEGDRREPTPKQVKNNDRPRYDKRLQDARSKMTEEVRFMTANGDGVNWDLMTWTIEGDTVITHNQETRDRLDGLLHFIGDQSKSFGLIREDEVYYRAGVVFSEIFKVIISATQSASKETEERNRMNPMEQRKVGELLRPSNPVAQQPIPLESIEPSTPPVQTVQE